MLYFSFQGGGVGGVSVLVPELKVLLWESERMVGNYTVHQASGM
jgi:hypothetical protein